MISNCKRFWKFADWRDPPNNSAADGDGKSLTLVRDVAGQVRVRWGRITRFLGYFAVGIFLATAICGRFASMRVSMASAALPLCLVAAYLVLVVDVQTQRLRSGHWGFRFSKRAIMLWTAITAVFLALTTAAVRDNQRGHAESERLTKELEAVVNGGSVAIGGVWGRNIFCHVTRPTFSDDDLARIIELASHGGTRPCELSNLTLAGTSITSVGVCKLAACEKLLFLELGPIVLSDDAIDSIAKCRRLETLWIDERRLLTAEQMDRLRNALPDVTLNGRIWAKRRG
jgi:hypothetical protein